MSVEVTNGVLLAKTLKSVEISNEKVILLADKLVIASGKVVNLIGSVKDKETGNYAGTFNYRNGDDPGSTPSMTEYRNEVSITAQEYFSLNGDAATALNEAVTYIESNVEQFK